MERLREKVHEDRLPRTEKDAKSRAVEKSDMQQLPHLMGVNHNKLEMLLKTYRC